MPEKNIEVSYHFEWYPMEDNSAFPPHKLCPYQLEKDIGDGEVLEIGFQNGKMYQITKSNFYVK